MFSNFFNNFLENIDSKFKNELYELSKIDGGSIDDMKIYLNTEYWRPHMSVFDNIELHKFHKDSKILDIGTWFGILPWVFNNYGFKNVDCSDWTIDNSRLNFILKKINVNPFYLNIQPYKKLNLNNKYDLILLQYASFHWKDDIIAWSFGSHFDPNMQELIYNWKGQIKDETGTPWNFFFPWRYNEWKFFIEDLKEYLLPNGLAIIGPRPYMYNIWQDKFKKELDLFKQHKILKFDKLNSQIIIKK